MLEKTNKTKGVKLDTSRIPLIGLGGFNPFERAKYRQLLEAFGYKPYRHVLTDNASPESFGYHTFRGSDDEWYYEEINGGRYVCPTFTSHADNNPALFFALAALQDSSDKYQVFLTNKELTTSEGMKLDSNTTLISVTDGVTLLDTKYLNANCSDIRKASSHELRHVLGDSNVREDVLFTYMHLGLYGDETCNVSAIKHFEDEPSLENCVHIGYDDAQPCGRPVITAFISLPISGKELEAMDKAKEIKDWLTSHLEGIEVVTPFEICDNDLDKPYSWYMGKDIEKLLQCNVVIQADGWEESKGCRCEATTADIYDIKRVSFRDLQNSLHPDEDAFRVWVLTEYDYSPMEFNLTDWERILTDKRVFVNEDAAANAYRTFIKTSAKRIETAITKDVEKISKSLAFYPDADRVFGSIEDAGLDYYRQRLHAVDIEGDDGFVYRYQFIPLITKMRRDSVDGLVKAD